MNKKSRWVGIGTPLNCIRYAFLKNLKDTKYQSIKLSFQAKWESVSEQNPLWLVINSYLAPEDRHKAPTVALYKVLDTK